MKTRPFQCSFTRICFAAGTVAGLAAIALNVTLVRQKIVALQSSLAAQTVARQNAERDLASTRTKLSATMVDRDAARTALTTANEDKQAALLDLADQKRLAARLRADLAKTTGERDSAQAALARYRATDMEPDQIIVAAQRIKQLAAALAAAEKTNLAMAAELKRWRPTGDGPVPLPASLMARVLTSDPKWHFILLDAGENQGVVANAEVLVRRQGKLVARARVTRVQGDRCIADLMPGWELAEVLEGDVVIPAFPRT